MGTSSEALHAVLISNGFIATRSTRSHWVFELDGERVVVPRRTQDLSDWVAATIEWLLEPRLGRRWLSTALATDPPKPPTAPEPIRLHLVVRPATSGNEGWNAFMVEEPRIIASGHTLDETHALARQAAAAWFGTDDDRIELQPLAP